MIETLITVVLQAIAAELLIIGSAVMSLVFVFGVVFLLSKYTNTKGS